jgi:hypothetical protein
MTPREVFIQRLRELETEAPFTQRETNKYSYQDRQFVRSLQVSTGMKKTHAITEMRKSKKDKNRLRRNRDIIEAKYRGDLDISRPVERPGYDITTKPVKKKSKYPYKVVTIRARANVVDRYQPDYSTKARRYRDTVTGETISRRERDKRIAKSLI